VIPNSTPSLTVICRSRTSAPSPLLPSPTSLLRHLSLQGCVLDYLPSRSLLWSHLPPQPRHRVPYSSPTSIQDLFSGVSELMTTSLAPELIWPKVSNNKVQKFNYSLVPATLSWLDISHNQAGQGRVQQLPNQRRDSLLPRCQCRQFDSWD
jgi:hypothetical protein